MRITELFEKLFGVSSVDNFLIDKNFIYVNIRGKDYILPLHDIKEIVNDLPALNKGD